MFAPPPNIIPNIYLSYAYSNLYYITTDCDGHRPKIE